MKDILCICTHLQKSLVPGIMPFLNQELFVKIIYNTKTVCQRNSYKIGQQNFIKLCSYEGNTVEDIFLWELCPFRSPKFRFPMILYISTTHLKPLNRI